MKKYFAKYLLVEGEIKEGNYIETKDGTYPLVKLSNGIFQYRHTNGRLFDIQDWHKQIKLFLCSRDIQVGDHVKFALTGASNGDGITDFGTVKECDIEEILKTPNYFKVIGEISPEAKWVKDGEEFGKNQMIREDFVINPFGEGEWYEKPLNENPPKLDVINEYGYTTKLSYIKIKCPCCETFK